MYDSRSKKILISVQDLLVSKIKRNNTLYTYYSYRSLANYKRMIEIGAFPICFQIDKNIVIKR